MKGIRRMKSFVLGLVFGFALVASPEVARAQQPAAPQPPAPQPQTPPAATQPQPARPFPAGAKFATIDVQRVAAESTEGKASTAKVQALNQKKVAELNELNKKLQSDQQKLQSQGAMLNDAARAELERSIDRQQKELQRRQQDAQDEVGQLQTDLQNSFQAKLYPVIQQVVTEKGIEVLFSARDSGIVLANPALDLTADVIKRFDAATAGGAAPPATPPATPAAPAKPQE
jgi:outer membrane protein